MQNRLRWLSFVLVLLVGLNAIAAGYGFMKDPTGAELGIGTDYLNSFSPFKDYLVPGIVLFFVLGMGSFLVAWMLWKDVAGEWRLVMILGAVYIGWIGTQLLMVDSFHVLHLIIGGIGIALVVMGWWENSTIVNRQS